VLSFGVKVTLSDCVPAVGAVEVVVKAKVPGIEVFAETADPPLRVDDARVWPYAIALAVGHVTEGVA
jgi:hypothetical protein